MARILTLAFAFAATLISAAEAQTPTPTPVDSNVAVSSYAQSRGIAPCASRGDKGCGGCYPAPKTTGNAVIDAIGELNKVNPEWQAISPMIVGGDLSLPPNAQPVLLSGTVALSKSPGDDFPATHVTSDYNAEVLPDNNGMLATGNGNHKVEFEYEGDKFPLYMWPGENDRMLALGRWIFDCGHPDPSSEGKCSNNATRSCLVDSDCASPGTCTNPPPVFNFQSELHPPQSTVVLRTKHLPAPRAGRTAPAIPATQANVYISADNGGAGDQCTVTHLASGSDVLSTKSCLLNHCSAPIPNNPGTYRPCRVDKDCASGQTCYRFDPALRLANINASDFEFDIPLPPPPSGSATLQIKTKNFKPKGGQMPKATFQPTLGPTPNLHVVVPMATPLPNGKIPNVFAQRITAGWKEDTTSLTHVQVKLKSITINNPVKDSTPVVTRQCTNGGSTGLSGQSCSTDLDCAPGTCFINGGKACHNHSQCSKKDFCVNHSTCVGGITPGWRLWTEVNGDWVELKKLETLGTKAPFAAPPFVQPSPTPLKIAESFKFDEFVSPSGSIHIKTTGRSFNCLNSQFGRNLIDGLNELGLTTGGDCLLAGSHDPGKVEVTLNGPNFGTTTPGQAVTFLANSTGSDAGRCSVTTNRLCVTNDDCPSGETCTPQAEGAYTLEYTVTVLP